MVADAISWLRTLGLYQDNGNEDVPITKEDVIKNIKEEVHLTGIMQKTPMYNVEKLNLDILRNSNMTDFAKTR